MIGIILLWAFMGAAVYSMYSMWTPAVASNIKGIVGAGFFGGVITLFVDGVSHISAVINDVFTMQADYGEYMFFIGFAFMLGVMIWNGLSTSGRTLVK